MDILLNFQLDDLGYVSGEEADGQHEKKIAPLPQRLPATPSSNVAREIALYDQRQIAEIERKEGETHRKHPGNLGFFPPHSNDKPRTSLQLQRQEEYSKPLYLTNENFQRLSAIRNDNRASHVRKSLVSSGAGHQDMPTFRQGSFPPVGAHTSRDTKLLASPREESHGQSHTSAASTLRSMAGSVSNSHGTSLTSVQRKILTLVQIPTRDSEEELTAADSEEERKDASKSKEARASSGNENREDRDSYDVVRLADEAKVKRKGQPQRRGSSDIAWRLKGIRGLRNKRGDSMLIKNH